MDLFIHIPLQYFILKNEIRPFDNSNKKDFTLNELLWLEKKKNYTSDGIVPSIFSTYIWYTFPGPNSFSIKGGSQLANSHVARSVDDWVNVHPVGAYAHKIASEVMSITHIPKKHASVLDLIILLQVKLNALFSNWFISLKLQNLSAKCIIVTRRVPQLASSIT